MSYPVFFDQPRPPKKIFLGIYSLSGLGCGSIIGGCVDWSSVLVAAIEMLLRSEVDFLTRWVLLCCDSTGDLYPVTNPFNISRVLLTSKYTWQQHLRHPGNGTLSRYKACLKTNVSTQIKGIDVDETFSLVVKPETVYMHQPLGFRPLGLGFSVLPLILLGLVLVIVFVTHPYLSIDRRNIASLHREFSMTDLGSLNNFLAISITGDSSWMFLSQRKYATEILERAHMGGCNSSRTLVDTESKLGDDVQHIYLYMHDPRKPHLSALKWILRNVRMRIGRVALPLRDRLLVRVLHVPPEYQYANIFTKGLPSTLFEEFLTSLSIQCPPAQTAGEC
nr:hypothetical protein [Tanacetum cinerariifolium]